LLLILLGKFFGRFVLDLELLCPNTVNKNRLDFDYSLGSVNDRTLRRLDLEHVVLMCKRIRYLLWKRRVGMIPAKLVGIVRICPCVVGFNP